MTVIMVLSNNFKIVVVLKAFIYLPMANPPKI